MTRRPGPRLILLAALLATTPAWAADDALFQALGGNAGIARLKADAKIGHFFKETKSAHLISLAPMHRDIINAPRAEE